MSYIDIESVVNGVKPGEMFIISGGRQTGKSYYYQKMLLNSVYGKIINTNLCKEIMIQPMPASKYKFSRSKWYQADFDATKYYEVRAWCREQFGPEPRNHDAWSRWHHKFEDRIMFRDEKDYVLFVLRWS